MQGESLILNAEETRDDRVVENLLRSVLGRKYLWGTEVEEQRDTGRRGKFWAFTCKKHTRGLTWFRHELLPEEFKASDDNAVYTYDGGTGVLNLSRLRLVRVLPHDDRHNLTIHSLHPCQCARSMPHYTKLHRCLTYSALLGSTIGGAVAESTRSNSRMPVTESRSGGMQSRHPQSPCRRVTLMPLKGERKVALASAYSRHCIWLVVLAAH